MPVWVRMSRRARAHDPLGCVAGRRRPDHHGRAHGQRITAGVLQYPPRRAPPVPARRQHDPGLVVGSTNTVTHPCVSDSPHTAGAGMTSRSISPACRTRSGTDDHENRNRDDHGHRRGPDTEIGVLSELRGADGEIITTRPKTVKPVAGQLDRSVGNPDRRSLCTAAGARRSWFPMRTRTCRGVAGGGDSVSAGYIAAAIELRRRPVCRVQQPPSSAPAPSRSTDDPDTLYQVGGFNGMRLVTRLNWWTSSRLVGVRDEGMPAEVGAGVAQVRSAGGHRRCRWLDRGHWWSARQDTHCCRWCPEGKTRPTSTRTRPLQRQDGPVHHHGSVHVVIDESGI